MSQRDLISDQSARTEWHKAIDRAANHMCAWLRENVSEYCCAELDELHPDTWREAAEVAIRAGRWEQDARPFTTSPHRLSDASDERQPSDG